MHIHLELTDPHSIEAYSDHEVRIQSVHYADNLIVSNHRIINPWAIKNILDLNEKTLAPILTQNPDILLIGHHQLNLFPIPKSRTLLEKRHIALECMSIASACRTFNILLNEQRAVILGIIFEN